jgi:signal transduction histidine kinase
MILDGDGGEVAPVARKYLENVFQNSTRLLMLINEMLDISKIES